MGLDENRARAFELAEALAAFANQTLVSNDDNASLLLVGVVRDAAAQIRRAAAAGESRPTTAAQGHRDHTVEERPRKEESSGKSGFEAPQVLKEGSSNRS
jgi:hypothetical protein